MWWMQNIKRNSITAVFLTDYQRLVYSMHVSKSGCVVGYGCKK